MRTLFLLCVIVRITALYRQLGCLVRTEKLDTLSAAMQESVRQSLHFIGMSSMPPQSVLVAVLTAKGVRAKRGAAAGDDSTAGGGEVGGDEMSGTLKSEEVDIEDDDDVVEVRRGVAGEMSGSGSTSWMTGTTGKTGGSGTSHKRAKSEPTASADESADATGAPPSAKRARREETSSEPQQQALERRVEAIARGLKRGLTRTRNRF